ncbi:hypothetical protein E2F50_02155 [Rhizobium deserti]|uniref:Uncharacterized protein n=1 Tax=Rhizobium deserti TaxID=2547961 RepID=A0A4R5UMK1_9HYPH|nr:hypothetical protein [Rhizobium deserti]TDK38968.1 hypothetical protein E2F50_02155 [Rhizobium deserti]
MKKREYLYLCLLGSVAIGSVIDSYIFVYDERLMIFNDIAQMLLIVIFSVLWEIEDGRLLGLPLRSPTRLLTVLFMPLGLLIYCLQSRRPVSGLLVYFGFLAGVIAAAVAGIYLGDWLVALTADLPSSSGT